MDVLLTCYIAAKNAFECTNYLNKFDKCVVETINKNNSSTTTPTSLNVDHCMEQYKSYIQYYCTHKNKTI